MKLQKRSDGWYDGAGGVEVWISLYDGPTVGACGGDQFGTDGHAVISAARAKDDAWTVIGRIIHPWSGVWQHMELGQYPNEITIDLQARTNETAVAKAMPYAIGWALRHVYQGK